MADLTLKTHISSMREQYRGGVTVYLVRLAVDADPGNACPAGQESLCSLTLALPEETCALLHIGQAAAFTLTPA